MDKEYALINRVSQHDTREQNHSQLVSCLKNGLI